MTQPVPRPGILEIAPYVGGESAIPGVSRVIKLASNESALGPSPRAVAALHDAAALAFRYPDGHCQALRAALAARFSLPAERIVCGAGSDELFGLIARGYAGPGDEILHTRHGFAMYPIVAHAVGATPVAAAERDLHACVETLLAAVTPRTRIVFLANPNNPTGTYLSVGEVERLRAGLPEDVVLVIDAAYAEYAEAADYSPGFELVDQFDNVVVTRTFSKIYGLGGLRLGWGYFPPAIADVLNRIRMPFNVSSLAQAAGLAALDDTDFLARARDHNRRWRQWTTEALRDAGYTVPESHCNFVLVRFPDETGREPGRAAAEADAFLKRTGIIARRMGAYHLPDYLRITIGQEAEMRALVEALAEFARLPA